MLDSKKILSNTELVFNLRTLMNESIKDLPYEISQKFSSFLDTTLISKNIDLSDIKKRGAYNGLLLGCNNPSLFNDFIGIHPKGFINDTASYLIEIERTFRESTILFEFLDQTRELQRKNIDLLIRIFKRYNIETDIEKFVYSLKIPALLVKGFDLSFLVEPDEDIKILLGANLIKKVRICIPFNSSDSHFSTIRSLNIITQNFQGLEKLDLVQIKNFFGKNLSEYNFIFLNDQNDYLISLFLNAIIDFEHVFKLQNILLGLHRNLFFIKDINYLLSSRLMNEKPEHRRFLDVEYESILIHKNNVINCNFVLVHLLLLSSNIRSQLVIEASPTVHLSDLSKTLITDFSSTIFNDESQLLTKYKYLTDELLTFQVCYTDAVTEPYKKNRENFFQKYENILNELLYFVGKYCRSIRSQVEGNISECISAKYKYTNVKSFLLIMEQYSESNIDFKKIVFSKIEEIKKIIEFIPSVIKIESSNLFFSEFRHQSSNIPSASESLDIEKGLTQLENAIAQELIHLMNR